MAPPPAGAGGAVRRVASSVGRPSEAPSRPPLKVVRSTRRSGTRRQGWSGQRVMTVVSVALVVGALLVVVFGQALLASGQVRMAAIQHELTLEQSSHRQVELQVSQLETPPRIVSAALGSGMVHAQVIEIPYVPTTTPLPAPTVTAAPAPTTTTTTAAATAPSTTTPTTTP
jgi:hypothetical protein